MWMWEKGNTSSCKFYCILTVCSKWDILPSEGHFGVKKIMAAILKCRSKPKCSKLATSKGPSEWRISKGTTDGHFGPHDPLCGFFARWRHIRIMTQKGTSRNSCLVPYTLQPFDALTPEGKPFEGISGIGMRPSEWNAGLVQVWWTLICKFISHEDVGPVDVLRDVEVEFKENQLWIWKIAALL